MNEENRKYITLTIKLNIIKVSSIDLELVRHSSKGGRQNAIYHKKKEQRKKNNNKNKNIT